MPISELDCMILQKASRSLIQNKLHRTVLSPLKFLDGHLPFWIAGVASRHYLSTLDERLDQIPQGMMRNFSIIAHIDHGKSTLTDRLLELTGTIAKSTKNNQVLDTLIVEKERGITVKAQTCSMIYNSKGRSYLLNLIDTPGHVDFRSEVSRSLSACSGCLLLVDATQGVQAQTVAYYHLATKMGLKIIPVINKIDLESADPQLAADQMNELFNIQNPYYVSAKKDIGVEQLLPAIIDKIPSPCGNPEKPFCSQLFDSWHDNYLGVISLHRIVDGEISEGDIVVSSSTKLQYEVSEVGIMAPKRVAIKKLQAGQVGYVICGMKRIKEAQIGDTWRLKCCPVKALPKLELIKPMVYISAYPVDSREYSQLEDAIIKLSLNDRGIELNKETAMALGQGFRLGLMGTLHIAIVIDRLKSEYGLEVLITTPTVPYLLRYSDGREKSLTNPNEFPKLSERFQKGIKIFEPMVHVTLIFPPEYIGEVLKLCEGNRGVQLEQNYMSATKCLMKYQLPLARLVTNFFSDLKSLTRGYASIDYEDAGYEESDLVLIQLLLNGQPLDPLSMVSHRSEAVSTGRSWVHKIKPMIERQLYEIAIQACVDNKIIARETIKACRKDVTAKCYGGDVTRKKKLLAKQKDGKKRMKHFGNVSISTEVSYRSNMI